MLPPQAPPASIQHANQAARDTLSRLSDTQQWLAQQQAGLPEPPYESADGLALALDAFWTTPVVASPGAEPVERRVAFAGRLAQLVRDDASLRVSDGTLPDDVLDAVVGITSTPATVDASHVTASELLVAGKPYAGALIVQDTRHAGRVLLFTTQGGWEQFASFADLYAGTLSRLGQMLFSGDDLPGLSGGVAAADDVLSARPIAGDVFTTLTARLIQHQGERMRHTWERQAPEDPAGADDMIRGALDLQSILDVHGIVAHRDVALLNLITATRLGAVPPEVRQAWEQAAHEYDMALVHDDWKRQADAIASPMSLMEYARKELTTRLAARGIREDASAIRLRVASLPDSALSFLFNGRDTRELSLLELAFVNANCARDAITVLDGVAPADLSGAVACEIVRDIDLGRAYLRHLVDFKGPSTEAQADRALAGALLRARMRFEAADARLAYHNPAEPPSFATPVNGERANERGYAWVKHILDHPSPYARPAIDGIQLKVEQLTYRGAAVSGVLLISAQSEGDVPGVVVYAPDAPRGMVFREFDGRAALEQDFLLNTAFESYLAERLPLAFSDITPNGIRRFSLSHLAEFRYKISPDTSCGFCTRLEEPFAFKEVTTSFLEELYFTQIDNAKLDTAHLTRRTRAADDDAIWAAYQFARVGNDLAVQLAKGTVMAFPHLAQAAWRFEDNIRRKDYTEAYLAAVSGYTSALNVVPFFSSLPRSVAGMVVRGPGRVGTEVVTVKLRPADTLFEERFIARGVTLPRDALSVDGIYTVNGAKYIRQGESIYKVQFDTTARAWRLTRDGAPHAAANGPLIEWGSGGFWHFQRAGLLGGRNDLFGEWMRTLPELVHEVRTLSFPQYAALRTRLTEILDPMTAARVYRAYGLNQPTSSTAITQTQYQAWRDALQHAQQVARDAPVPLSLRVLPTPPSARGAHPPGAFVIDTATDDALRQLQAEVVPQLRDFTANEFALLADRLSRHLDTASAARVFRTLGRTRPAVIEVMPSLTERTIWREAVAWVHSLRPLGSPPLPSFLD